MGTIESIATKTEIAFIKKIERARRLPGVKFRFRRLLNNHGAMVVVRDGEEFVFSFDTVKYRDLPMLARIFWSGEPCPRGVGDALFQKAGMALRAPGEGK